jgi:hypothetical protein
MTEKANAYVKLGCPHCFKFLLYMTEAGLLEQINIIEPNPDSEEFEHVRAMLSEKLRKKATFPTVEIEPGKFMNESDDLIAHYANQSGKKRENMEVLALYERGLFPRIREMFFTNRAYKEKYGDIEVVIP